MIRNYAQYTNKIRRNYNPDQLVALNASYNREFEKNAGHADVKAFVRLAMNAVDKSYTQKSIEAGRMARGHLSKELLGVDYEFQGSVMTDTHIKGHSDIDLLVLETDFYGYSLGEIVAVLNSASCRRNYSQSELTSLNIEKNSSDYSGNAELKLMELRLSSERILRNVYSLCDTTKGKSIKITNQNLHREVDVVVANWYDNARSIVNGKNSPYRGVQIFDKQEARRGSADFPFLKIKLVNDKSSQTGGRLKRIIRFMKNCKVLIPDKVSLSSFDINAIGYDIPSSSYSYADYYGLVPVILNKLVELASSRVLADELKSVDGTEYIFRYNTQKFNDLRHLIAEIRAIQVDLRSVAA